MSNILCIGEMLIDFIEEKPSLVKRFTLNPGGAPANVAQVIGILGGKAFIMGSVGKDSFGNEIENVLIKNNVSNKYLRKVETPTTISFVTIDENGDRDFIFYRGADKDFDLSQIELNEFADFDIVHFGSATALLEGKLNSSYQRLLEISLKENKFISFDPNYRNFFWNKEREKFKNSIMPFIQKSDLVKLNEEELQIVAENESTSEAINILRERFNTTFAVTLGKNGSIIFNKNYEINIGAEKIKAIDTTGAGDGYIGAFLYKVAQFEDKKMILADRDEIIKIAHFSNDIAGKICTRYGALTALID
ncbi:carbohydrate kinase [Soehngenia saccharolytica]|nr:carbohydrate kinase [Soehngenia saccharolytica]